MTTFQQVDFAQNLGYFQVRIWLPYIQEDSGKTGGGDDITTDMADPLWRGEITLDQRLKHAEAAAIDAQIALLNGVIGRFYMCDPRLPFPIKDPDGSILGGATVKILDISSDRTRIQAKSLPGFYWLSCGDRFHVNFGTSPAHRGYHWIGTTIQASNTGNTDWISIAPHLDEAINVNDEIVLRKPSPLWRFVAGSVQSGVGQGSLTPGASWQMVQVP